MFCAADRKKCIAAACIAVVLTVLGAAVRLGEDNQVGSSNEWSFRVWVTAGVFAYWAVLQGIVLIFRRFRKK